MPASERANALAHLPMVDLVVIDDDDSPEELLQALRPDLLVGGSSQAGHSGSRSRADVGRTHHARRAPLRNNGGLIARERSGWRSATPRAAPRGPWRRPPGLRRLARRLAASQAKRCDNARRREGGERVPRRIAEQVDGGRAGDDQPGVVGQQHLREIGVHCEVEAVAVLAVFRPFRVDQEIARPGFDLDARKAAVRRERQDVGAPPVRQRHLMHRRPAELQAQAGCAAPYGGAAFGKAAWRKVVHARTIAPAPGRGHCLFRCHVALLPLAEQPCARLTSLSIRASAPITSLRAKLARRRPPGPWQSERVGMEQMQKQADPCAWLELPPPRGVIAPQSQAAKTIATEGRDPERRMIVS